MDKISVERYYRRCRLCGRQCLADRRVGRGACGMSEGLMISRAALHHWEEPPISGSRGSGTVFFSGCSLSCLYCQNKDISHGGFGASVTVKRLRDIMLELMDKGAHNINLVTPTHFIPSIALAIDLAREKGMTLPIVYNTGGYDSPEALGLMEGRVSVYLPDLKYYRSSTAKALSGVDDYPERARQAIAEMYRQVGRPVIEQGIMTRGVIVRILLLPGHLAEAKLNLKYLYENYGDNIYISLMNQYTPMPNMPPPRNRTPTSSEYGELTDYALRLGVTNAFIQEGEAQSESFIPPFDLSGV